MKRFFVIGNPIDHSLSPKLQNHWLKENNIVKSDVSSKNLFTNDFSPNI